MSITKLKQADDAYYNTGKPILTDEEYDKLKEKAQKKNPDHPYFKEVGAKPKHQDVTLPMKTGSLVKLRPSKVAKWVEDTKARNYILSPKLDGMSLIVEYSKAKLVTVYTRGNGVVGRDVTSTAIHCNIPKKITLKSSHKKKLYVRGELVIRRDVYAKKLKDKTKYTSERNLCSGLINTINNPNKKHLSYLDFVVYNCSLEFPSKYKELQVLKDMGFTTIDYFMIDNAIDEIFIKEKLYKLEENSKYLIDGLVIEVDSRKIIDKLGYESNGLNPKFARSIKREREDHKFITGKVKEINWNYTKRRIYKPTIILKTPLDFNGIKVSRIYGHNIKYLMEKGIDKGAHLNIIRSGDVIPYVQEVKKSSSKNTIPNKCEYCNTKLKYNTDLYCPNKKCVGAKYLEVLGFFETLKPDGLQKKTIIKLFDAGYNTVKKILRIKPEDLEQLDSFGTKKSNNIVSNIHKELDGISLARIMHCSGYFMNVQYSLGTTRLQAIISVVGRKKILNNKVKLKDISAIDSVGPETAELFVNQLPEFLKFYDKIADYIKLGESKGTLLGKSFVFTGFRNKYLQGIIEENGGKVTSSISSKNAANTIVFCRDKSTEKVQKAIKYQIPIYEEFEAEKTIKSLL